MRRAPSRRLALAATTALIASPLAAALPGSASAATPAAAKPSGSLTAAAAAALSRNANQHVIVLLDNQLGGLAAKGAQAPLRAAAAASTQAPLLREMRQVKARNVKSFSLINGFAATVSSAEARRLASTPGVRAVVPDRAVSLAPMPSTEKAQKAAASSAASAAPGACPSNPAHPLLEPEALQQTHTAFLNRDIPQARNLATGRGVKVAWVADGIDINNPDFIRPNGQHVFIDYKDFSGGGPNEPVGGGEAFGDASSIAAQGRITYDLSNIVSVNHPLPAGCTIRILGVAPGASLVGIKSFSTNFASTSSIVQGIEYAVNVDHVDVINESFGSNPFPDRNTDPISLVNDAAVDAGVVVVSSTGDAGTAGTIGSPSSDPKIISAAATTSFRSYAQATSNGFQLAPSHRFISGQISSLSSGGITQQARVPDVSAPGDLNWALCSPNPARWADCTNFDGTAGAPVQQFGGTSESSPLTAGEAALVIQAYRDTHHGVSPSPLLVKRIITSTADDLRHPSAEQGSGQINTLRAVLAARSIHDANGSPRRTSNQLLVTPTQLSVQAHGGARQNLPVRVTNLGSRTQSVHAHVRFLGKVVSNQRGTAHLNLQDPNAPFYVDAFGIPRTYTKVHFTIPRADRLDVAIAAPEPVPASPVRIILFDPNGVYRAYSIPQGQGNFAHVDVSNPPAGRWTAIFAASQGSSFNGPVHFQVVASDYVTIGRVTPSTVRLAPGQSAVVRVHLTAPRRAGDINPTLVLDPSRGRMSTVPIVIRTLVATSGGTGRFSGSLTGGNGRGYPAQTLTYFMDVPRGLRDMGVGLRVSGNTNEEIQAYLISPQGEVLGNTSNQAPDGTATSALQIFQLHPAAGRWELAIVTLNPIAGDSTTQPFTGTVRFNMVHASASGLPTSASTVLTQGTPVHATIRFTNTGVARQGFFADPRRRAMGNLTLVPQQPATNLAMPASTFWIVPTEVDRFAVATHASEPVQSDLNYNTGEPEVISGTTSANPVVAVNGHPVADGPWFVGASPIGPFSAPAPAATASFAGVAHAKLFDRAVTSSTGDVWLGTVDASAGASPIVLGPGQSGTISLTITPTAPKGSVVHGFVYVDNFSSDTGAGDELVAFPYTYTVGGGAS